MRGKGAASDGLGAVMERRAGVLVTSARFAWTIGTEPNECAESLRAR